MKNYWKTIIVGLAAGFIGGVALCLLGSEDFLKENPPTEPKRPEPSTEPDANSQTDAQFEPAKEKAAETATLEQKAVLSKYIKSYRLGRQDIDLESKGMLVKDLEFILSECILSKEYPYRCRPIKTMLEEIIELYKNDSFRYKFGIGTYYSDIILRELEAIKSEINQLENE